MTEQMDAALSALPEDLRPAASSLWSRTRAVTAEAEDTLTAAYRILGQIRGEPERLDSGAELLSASLGSGLAEAREELDQVAPRLLSAWSGASDLADHLPQLSRAADSAVDGAAGAAVALAVFRQGMVRLWGSVVERTERASGVVAAAAGLGGVHPLATVVRVLDTVADYADYVEELAESLLELTDDAHEAGQAVAQLEVMRLPQLNGGAAPAHDDASLDLETLNRLAGSLGDSRRRWDEAVAVNAEVADVHLTPQAFGLAGSHFYAQVQELLAKERAGYAEAAEHLSRLAQSLHQLGADYEAADEELDERLRRLDPP